MLDVHRASRGDRARSRRASRRRVRPRGMRPRVGSAERPPTSRGVRQAPTRREGGGRGERGGDVFQQLRRETPACLRRPKPGGGRRGRGPRRRASGTVSVRLVGDGRTETMDEPKRTRPGPGRGNALPKRRSRRSSSSWISGRRASDTSRARRAGFCTPRVSARTSARTRRTTPRTSRRRAPRRATRFRMFRMASSGSRVRGVGGSSPRRGTPRRERVGCGLRSPGPREAARGGA